MHSPSSDCATAVGRSSLQELCDIMDAGLGQNTSGVQPPAHSSVGVINIVSKVSKLLHLACTPSDYPSTDTILAASSLGVLNKQQRVHLQWLTKFPHSAVGSSVRIDKLQARYAARRTSEAIGATVSDHIPEWVGTVGLRSPARSEGKSEHQVLRQLVSISCLRAVEEVIAAVIRA